MHERRATNRRAGWLGWIAIAWVGHTTNARAQSPSEAPAAPETTTATPAPAPDSLVPPPGYATPDMVIPAAPRDAAVEPAPAPLANGLERDDIRYVQANSDRVLLFSTAETHPEGTVFFSDYELVLLQLGYAFTDTAQVALTALPPLVEEQPYLVDLSLKANLVRTPTFRFALLGALSLVGVDDSSAWGARLGTVGTLCFDPRCYGSLSLNASSLLSNEIEDVLPVLLSAGLSIRLGRVASLLVEPAYTVSITREGDDFDRSSDLDVEGAGAFLLSYGVRLGGADWGVDIAFVRPVFIDDEDRTAPFVLGLPFLAFTYRTDVAGRPNHGLEASATR